MNNCMNNLSDELEINWNWIKIEILREKDWTKFESNNYIKFINCEIIYRKLNINVKLLNLLKQLCKYKFVYKLN